MLQWESLRDSRGDAFIKFEPFVLHVQCACLVDAQLLVSSVKLCVVGQCLQMHYIIVREETLGIAFLSICMPDCL